MLDFIIAPPHTCFNSTLVQLKDTSPLFSNLHCKCFNSTLVQLKEHYDIILFEIFFGFNSTLVQLKV